MNVRANNASRSNGANATMMAAFVFVVVVVVVVVLCTTADALTPNSSSSSSSSPSSASSSYYYSILSSASKKSSSSPFGIHRFTLHESTNGINGGGGMNGDDMNGNGGINGGIDGNGDGNERETDLKSKSDTDIVNGIHYPFPSPPPPPVAAAEAEAEAEAVAQPGTETSPEEDDQYSAFSYFTDTSSSSSSSSSTAPAEEDEEDHKEDASVGAPYNNFLSVDGNGSGGLMGRSEGTGGTDATLMMGDTAKNKATPVDSGSVHLPTTQDLLKSSSLTEVSGNSVVHGPKAEAPRLTNASDEPVARPTVPQNDDTATSLHVSNIVFAGPTTASTTATATTAVPVDDSVENVIPTILKRYVPPPPPPPKEDHESPSSPTTSSSSLTGTSTGGANHFASPEPPKIKVRRFVPGRDDEIFKHPEPKKDNESTNMLPVQRKKLKPYTRPVTKPAARIALPEGAVAVSTTTTPSASALSYSKPTPTTLSDESATTNPKSTKLVRIVSEETTSTIPHDDPKDRYSNEFQGPTSATLHQKTGLQVNTPVSLWEPRDKFLDR